MTTSKKKGKKERRGGRNLRRDSKGVTKGIGGGVEAGKVAEVSVVKMPNAFKIRDEERRRAASGSDSGEIIGLGGGGKERSVSSTFEQHLTGYEEQESGDENFSDVEREVEEEFDEFELELEDAEVVYGGVNLQMTKRQKKEGTSLGRLRRTASQEIYFGDSHWELERDDEYIYDERNELTGESSFLVEPINNPEAYRRLPTKVKVMFDDEPLK